MNGFIGFLKDVWLVIGCLVFTIVVHVTDRILDLNEPGLATMCYVMLYLLCLNLLFLRATIVFHKEDIDEAYARLESYRNRLNDLNEDYHRDIRAERQRIVELEDSLVELRTRLIYQDINEMRALYEANHKEQRGRILEL